MDTTISNARRILQSVPRLALLVVAGIITASFASADVITLNSGQSVTGEVLKETDRDLLIDVGFDILRVPLERIASRLDETAKQAAGPNAIVEDASKLFRVRTTGATESVRELSAKLGEGVVLVQTPGGLGSGFIINDRGYCITNFHVVEKETRLSVTLFLSGDDSDVTRKRIGDVEILALSPFMDLALLRIPKPSDYEFVPVSFATDNSLQDGQPVFAIGNPLGLERSVSQGIVSTKNRNFDGLTYIQTTTEINPGNSGGPLFDRQGRVVGVTNMKLTFGEGLGFAIPIRYVKDFLRNRDAFAYDRNQPNTGYRYLDGPSRAKF